MEKTEFILARVADEEAWTVGADCSCPRGERLPRPNCPAHVLAMCGAVRQIVAWHEQWPTLVQVEPAEVETVSIEGATAVYRIAQQLEWMTNREYVARFGVEAPSSPIIDVLARVWLDHPDFDPSWAA